MPEYTVVITHIEELQAKYEAEIKRYDREFTVKYADFIEEQSTLPDNIRMKRHKELQELMEKSMAYKDEIHEIMREARREMMEPLYTKVDEAVMKVCVDGGPALSTAPLPWQQTLPGPGTWARPCPPDFPLSPQPVTRFGR